jgi:hypothetical protein
MQAQVEAQLAAAATANGASSAEQHRTAAVDAAQKAIEMADAASFANQFVDNPDLNGRFTESITAARQDAIAAKDSVESLTQENAAVIAEELNANDEATQEEVKNEDLVNNDTEEDSAFAPTQLNPEITGGVAIAEPEQSSDAPAPNIENADNASPDATATDTTIAESQLLPNDALNAAIDQIDASQKLGFDQFGQTQQNRPSAQDIQRSINL